MLYERGRLNTGVPFEALRAAGHVNGRARAADADPDFSRAIREGLPPGRLPPARAWSESEADQVRMRLGVRAGEVELGLALGVDLEERLAARHHVPDGVP